MLEILHKTNIDFMGWKKVSFSVAAVMITLGLIALVQVGRGKANLGIDFVGGTTVQLSFKEKLPLDEARTALEKAGFAGASLQEFSEGNKVLIRLREHEGVAEKVVALFKQTFPNRAFEVDSSTEIGPTIGQDLQKDALLAVIFSIIAIIIYIAIRFEFKFGVAAAFATVHDVCAVLAIFFILNKEINLLIVTALKINEYGIFSGHKKIAGAREDEIYATLHMDWIPPELREDRGEMEAALNHTLPSLVSHADIRGDLHVHSVYSDGTHSLADIAAAGQKMGYHYIAITDHSSSLKIARGLSAARLKEKIAEVKRINQSFPAVRLLCGTEVDIKNDGTLDYPDTLLSQLDIVVGAIHSGFKRSREQITTRMTTAIHNPYLDIIAYPRGRLLGGPEAYDVYMAR